MMKVKEALLWEPFGEETGKLVKCHLCRHGCVIVPGKRGLCRVRENRDGKLYALTYGRPCSTAVDPIEKKPLFHFLPGTDAFSIATVGCNFRCLHCQNWEISQANPEDVPSMDLPPERVVEEALRTNCKSIAYTYTEPTVFFEYAFDTSRIAHEHNLKNVFVTNGYMSPEMIKMYDTLDAANVDIKGDETFYKKVVGGSREGVLDSIKLLHKKGVHVEVTNLIIPGYNDDKDSIVETAEFVKTVSPEMPLHFTAFFPNYKLTEVKPTSRETLVMARKLAIDVGMKYAYCGNTYPGDPYENTYCPNCGELLIARHGYNITSIHLDGTRCPQCGAKVNVVLE